MEYYKTYCQEHSYEPITNFCTDPQCLVGLCATCICQHTQSHLMRGSSPSYENIKNTYSRYNDRMKEQIDLIEQDKTWLNNICHNIEEKRQTVKDTLAKAREDCLNLVNKHFDDLEIRINSEIVNQTKKNSLHSAYRLETLNTLMLKEMSNLLMYSKDLSSNKFLETAKIVEEDVFPNSRDFHLKVCKELKENEVYTATAVYKEECLADLVYGLKRLVNLEFLLPRVEYVEGPPKFERADKLDDAKRSFSLKRNNSAIVMNRPHDLRISQLAPKHTASIVMSPSSNPLNLLQQYAMNRSQVASPMLHKSSRLSNCSNFASNLQSGLKIIRETKRENTQAENRSMTNSSVSCTNKENDLARSCYIDTGSSFYR